MIRAWDGRHGHIGLAALVVAVLVALATAGAAEGSVPAAEELAPGVVLVSATSLDRSGGSTGFEMVAYNVGDRSATISVPAPAPAERIAADSGIWDGLRWQVVLGPQEKATLQGS